MLRGIRFNDERFDDTDYNNLLYPLTANTIIICPNFDMMSALAKDIYNTVNGRAEHNDYDCDEEDVGQAKYGKNFFLQKEIKINDQTITLCLEPAMVYKAKAIEDIWFLDSRRSNNQILEEIYPMTQFRGAQEVWDDGLDAVYSIITIGRYGGYSGEWIGDDRRARLLI